MTVVLVICSYLSQEFIRVGYYVDNDYVDPLLREVPPEPTQIDLLQRNILADKPRVTRFNIIWDPIKATHGQEELPQELLDLKVDDNEAADWDREEIEEGDEEDDDDEEEEDNDDEVEVEDLDEEEESIPSLEQSQNNNQIDENESFSKPQKDNKQSHHHIQDDDDDMEDIEMENNSKKLCQEHDKENDIHMASSQPSMDVDEQQSHRHHGSSNYCTFQHQSLDLKESESFENEFHKNSLLPIQSIDS